MLIPCGNDDTTGITCQENGERGYLFMRHTSMKHAFALIPCALFMALLTGCSGEHLSSGDSSQRETVTVTDAAGRIVAIPDSVTRVVSPFTMYTRLIAAIGGQGKLVGISHNCLLPEEEIAHGVALLSLPDVGQFGSNIELIASLKPDVIFASEEYIASFEEKTDAAVVCVSFPHGTDIRDMFRRQTEIIGSVLRMEREAADLIDFMDRKFALVTDIAATIPDNEKQRVYFAWTSWTGDIINTIYDFDPITLAGGINVAGESQNFAPGERGILVSREHIINWDPDVILLSPAEAGVYGQESVTIGDVLADPLLKDVSAIKNKRVNYTTSLCNWWPQHRAIVQTMYIAKLLYPDRFADLDVEAEGNEIFKRFYGDDALYSRMAVDLGLYRWE